MISLPLAGLRYYDIRAIARMGSPAMTGQRQTAKILDLERAVLCAICCEFTEHGDSHDNATQNPVREALRDAVRDLADYSWLGTEHAVVYMAIAKLQPSGDATIWEELPAQVTRMGFPDVDWKLYLQPNDAPRVEIAELVRTLKAQTAKS